MKNTTRNTGIEKSDAEEAITRVINKEEKLRLDLPEVKDIPGQEHIRPPLPGEYRDTTIASADEEGDEIFNEEEDEIVAKDGDNVSPLEKRMLREAAEVEDTAGEEELKRAVVDNTDKDGEPLNEVTGYKDLSAKDLDIADEYEDDEDEQLGKDPAR
jgi:hypothetical protein